MKNEIHRHLDGELPADALTGADRAVVDEWDRMVASFRRAAPDGGAPAWLEQRVMSDIHSLPEPSLARRIVGWLVSPAPIRVSPLAAGLVAAAVVLALVLPGPRRGSPDTGPIAAAPTEIVYVQFMLDAPMATSVAVAGDFTDWEPAFTLDDPDGDGIWSGRVPVRAGLHAYMFLVDDTEWMTDPNAARYQDDGFGNRNAVLAVGTSG